jgi:hypothetical protein
MQGAAEGTPETDAPAAAESGQTDGSRAALVESSPAPHDGGPTWGPPGHAELALQRLGAEGPYAYVPHRPAAHQVKGSGHTHCAPDHSGISAQAQQERLRDLPGEHAHGFVWMTAHNFVAADPNVPGIEHMYGAEIYTAKQADSGSEPHLLAYLPNGDLVGTDARPFGYFEHDVNAATALVRAAGGVTAWAHPSREPLSDEELDGLRDLWGMEVVSGATDVEENLKFVDRRLEQGHYVCLTGGGDIHDEDYRMTRGYQLVDVPRAEPSAEELFTEVSSCNFFVCETKDTDGAPVDSPTMFVADDAIAVSVETPADVIRFIGNGGAVLHEVSGAKTASYPPRPEDGYVRAEIVASGGQARCFTQPVWLLSEVPSDAASAD